MKTDYVEVLMLYTLVLQHNQFSHIYFITYCEKNMWRPKLYIGDLKRGFSGQSGNLDLNLNFGPWVCIYIARGCMMYN